jgi:division protein CdvB (Snf7/Vps24/ESCRT-III family)
MDLLEITLMNTVNPNTASTGTGNTAESKQILLKDIGAKWSKFSQQELSALKSKDDLINQVVTKYSLEKAQVQRDVDAVMKGRQI